MALALAWASSSGVREKPKWRNVSLSSTSNWSKKANCESSRWPSTTWPSSCASMVARLASSGSTSIKPRLSTIVAQGERFKGGGHKHAAAHLGIHINVVGNFQVIDDGFE